jgi:hypothetical protein
MTTFPVTLPSGAVVQIGGEPLCSEEKIKRLFPDLWAHVLSKDKSAPMNNEELEKFCFHIVKHFNSQVQEETFCIDHYSAREIVRAFYGQMEDKKKADQM